MKLTDEQRRAVTADGNVCLISCPGSGKTRAIIAKLLRCIEEVRDSTRRVACITHTNAAADEIDSRLRQMCFSGESDYYEVTTIHSFALHAVLRPFHRRLPEFGNGFTIVTPDDEAYVERRRSLMDSYRIDRRRSDEFDGLQRLPDGSPCMPDGFPSGAAQEWFSWLDASAFITLADIVYHACRLVAAYEFIVSALASRYAWVLVDEFQDSSPSQLFILRCIHRYQRTAFFCVGDPNQSIYGFAGASPSLVFEFAAHISASTSHRLSANFRCSDLITRAAERLLPTVPPMTSLAKHQECTVPPSWRCCESPVVGVLEDFIPTAAGMNIGYGHMAVLAPWWMTLFPIARRLREKGVPVIGPGARPYKRDNPFSLIAEAMGAYLESREPEIAHGVQRALFITLSNLTGEPSRDLFRYSGRILVCELLAEATAARREREKASEWVQLAAERFTYVLVNAGRLSEAHKGAFMTGARTMAADIERYSADGTPLTIEDLGIFARPKNCVQLMTIHKAKGREFQAVAVVDAHDGRLPHFGTYKIPDAQKKLEAYNEARRVVYVATTRAERLLMYFTDTTHPKNTPSPFLRELGLISSAR